MKGRRSSVRRRLTTSFVLFALALGGLFGGVTLLVYHRVEDRMLRTRLEQMVDAGEHRRSSVSFVGPPASAPARLQQRLSGLSPGFHEWEEGDSETHVLLVADSETGKRTVAVVSLSESESSERRFGLALGIGVAVTSLLALLLARTLAVRIVSPIERLTERLTTGSLDALLPGDVPFDPAEEGATGGRPTDEIAMLERALARAGRELTASAERERRFLREASHELRTPITVIQGVSDLLRESMDAGDKITRQRLERLDRGLSRMNTSVLSLLAMARAEHRLMATDMPPFEQQLEDMIEEARSLASPGVEVTFRLNAAPSSKLAASMLIVALSNLTRNAVEHTESGTVEVVVDASRASVHDNGPGLPPALLDQLRSSGPQPDAGIGLATVQRVCRRFEWRFNVECPAGSGTIATIEMTSAVDEAQGAP